MAQCGWSAVAGDSAGALARVYLCLLTVRNRSTSKTVLEHLSKREGDIRDNTRAIEEHNIIVIGWWPKTPQFCCVHAADPHLLSPGRFMFQGAFRKVYGGFAPDSGRFTGGFIESCIEGFIEGLLGALLKG